MTHLCDYAAKAKIAPRETRSVPSVCYMLLLNAGIYDASDSKRFFLGVTRNSRLNGVYISNFLVAVSKSSDPKEGEYLPVWLFVNIPMNCGEEVITPMSICRPPHTPPHAHSRSSIGLVSQGLKGTKGLYNSWQLFMMEL
jgi:hypothetical protein